MDPRFGPVFDFLYDAYAIEDGQRLDAFSYRDRLGVRRPQDLNFAGISQDAIERAVRARPLGLPVRADARHFLLVTFTEMIVKPVGLVGPPGYSRTELAADVQADAADILRTASESASDGELTGGDVLRAAAERYTELRVARYRVWN